MRCRPVMQSLVVLAWAGAALATSSAAGADPSMRMAAPGPNATAHGTPPGAAVATDCQETWERIPTPDVAGNQVSLAGVAAVSANDVWSVGSASPRFLVRDPLIEHWDVAAWTVVPSPDVRTPFGLHLVSASSSTDAWAAGQAMTGEPAVLEHWDGTSWTLVPSRVNSSIPTGLVDFSPTDAWVSMLSIEGPTPGVIAHWDGTRWSRVSVPSPSPNASVVFWSIDGEAPDDLWVAGELENPSRGIDVPVFLRYDGSSWHVIGSPHPGDLTRLHRVIVLGPDDVWATGTTYNGQRARAFLEHWDGTTWTVTRVPRHGHGENWVGDVEAGTTPAAWAVGGESGTATKATVLSWDGAAWTFDRSGIPAASASAFGSLDAADGVLWAVGTATTGGREQGLVERRCA